MAIFTRDFIHKIVLCVLLPLFFFNVLPYATCQQEYESSDRNFSARATAGIILLGMSVSAMLSCCLFYAFYRVVITELEHEVLDIGARSGVDKEIIESFPLPLFLYSEVKWLKIGQGGVECAICLNEFEDEETLRWMPPCSHIFHANCIIDVWLSSRSTCPVCRTNLTLKPDESFPYPSMDLETGNVLRGVLQSPDNISLTGNNNGNYRITRSRSTGLLSSRRTAEILYPRSHSTGHSLDKLGENLYRFTLQLPEEVQRHFVGSNLIRRSSIALPHSRSSRQGYRSGSIGSSHRKGRL